MPERKRTLAVTGLNATDNPAPGVPVVRSVRHSPGWRGKVVGLAYDSFDTGIYDENVFDAVYMIPYPTEGEENLLQRLRYVVEKEKIDVVIPTLDSELANFSRIEPDLKTLGTQMLIPTEYHLTLRSKLNLAKFCAVNSIPVPRTMIANDPGQIPMAAAQFGLPLVIKGIFYEAMVANSVTEGVTHFNKIKTRWGLPIILQEYIAGEEYCVVGLGNRKGKALGAVPMRKLRLTEKGKGWAGITVGDEELLDLARRTMAALKWVGPLELEFMRATVSQKFFLLEINPRFPAWVYLAARAGQNLPLAAVRLAAGEDVKPFEKHDVGVIFVRHAVDIVCPIDYLGQLTTDGELHYS
ncbi:MAG: ATP-grasp domain-containing protein [Planctomycetota bacterium]|nr:ATP-grasp domain-containing protein [Planctomycetota bacterium]